MNSTEVCSFSIDGKDDQKESHWHAPQVVVQALTIYTKYQPTKTLPTGLALALHTKAPVSEVWRNGGIPSEPTSRPYVTDTGTWIKCNHDARAGVGSWQERVADQLTHREDPRIRIATRM